MLERKLLWRIFDPIKEMKTIKWNQINYKFNTFNRPNIIHTFELKDKIGDQTFVGSSEPYYTQSEDWIKYDREDGA